MFSRIFCVLALLASSLLAIPTQSAQKNDPGGQSGQEVTSKSTQTSLQSQDSATLKTMQEEHGDDAKEDAEALHQKQKELYFLKGQLQQIEEEDLQSVNQKGKSGLFLGVGVGNMLFNYNAKLDYPVLLNFRIGYQQFFPRTSAGLRFYADMANVFYGKQKQTIWAALTTLNIDVVGDIMLDKKKRYGISFSGGIGAGSLMGKRTSRDAALFGFNNNKLEKQWALTFNLGVGVVLNLKHRIELQMKIPPSSLEINSFLKFRSVYMVNYQYTF